MNSRGAGESGISGKKIVPLLYGGALLLCAGLLAYGLYYRSSHRVSPPLPTEDRLLLADLPREWTRITKLEGQGWVVFVPCNSEAGSLVVESDAENPRLLCAWCDTVQEAVVRRVTLKGKPVKVRLKLGTAGTAWVEPVDETVRARFPGALLRDYVLTWTLPSGDAYYFVPTEQARDFEVLRAEDESPEGCGGE
jgi:hypothetical protein